MGKSNLFPNIFFSTIVGVPLFLYGQIIYDVTIGVRNRFEEAYEGALIRYADTNQEGVITLAEKKAYTTSFLNSFGLIHLLGEERPRLSSTGEEIPWETLIELVENYQPEEE